jgi:Tol biopolymer transport system component
MHLLRRVVPVLPLLLLLGCAEQHPSAPEHAPHEALFSRDACEPGPNYSCAAQLIDEMVGRVDALELDRVLNRGQAQPLRNHLINAKRVLLEGRRQAADAQLGAAEERVTRLLEDAVLTLEQASPLLDGLAEVLGKVLTGTIAFTSDRDGNHEIYRLNLASGLVTRLTNHDRADEDPAWSPDGTRIAFASNRRGNHEIYVMDADGSNLARLTTTGVNRHPTWSPDGSRIAFRRSEPLSGAAPNVWVMNADGSDQELMFAGSEPAWSPDGKQMAYTALGSDGRYVVNVRNIDGPPQTQTLEKGQYAAWSPGKSRTIAFIRQISFLSSYSDDIYTVKPDGTFLKEITSTRRATQPDWSPSGQQIAFADRGLSTGDTYDLFVTSWWGSTPVRLTTHPSNNWDPSWKP